MNDKNPHNARLRLITAGCFADWLRIEKIWTSARKLEASRAATDALDDFLKEYSSPSTSKAKE
jgi:hypothetical protein